MSVGDNIRRIRKELPETIKLVAVSKTKSVEIIKEAYDAGHRIFGENKALEIAEKQKVLPRDIEWHFIGHLQTNKIKYIAPFVNLIHSVDSLNLLREINREAIKQNRTIDCLLQFHIAEEETKFGFSDSEAFELLSSAGYKELKNIRLTGVMGMATFTADFEKIRLEFRKLREIFNGIKNSFFKDAPHFSEISMGMSDDYRIAVEEGCTIVRIGSSIFGERNQNI